VPVMGFLKQHYAWQGLFPALLCLPCVSAVLAVHNWHLAAGAVSVGRIPIRPQGALWCRLSSLYNPKAYVARLSGFSP